LNVRDNRIDTVRSIIELGHGFNLQVIAEVEEKMAL